MLDYTPDAFRTAWKPIRNKLSEYWNENLFSEALKQLHRSWGKSILEITQERIQNPWHVLSIIKWGLTYSSPTKSGKKLFGQNEFAAIYNKMLDLPAQLHLMEGRDDIALWRFIRASFSTQFYFQNNTGYYGLAVLDLILKNITIDYPVDEKLTEYTGLNLEEFITFQLFTEGFIAAQNRPMNYTVDYFKGVFAKYPREKAIAFFKAISLDFQGLVGFLSAHHRKVNNPEFEYSLLSPLHQFPFLSYNGKFIPFHPVLLQHHIEYGIYDLLKTRDGRNFSQMFGAGFEEYASLPIKSLGIPFFREGDLKRLLREDSVVDFGIPQGNDLLLIEVKSAEMHSLTLQDPRIDYLRRTLENSVFKGYRQIFNTARKATTTPASSLLSEGEVYGIIITFKQLFLGTPDSIWKEFMKQLLEESLSREVVENPPLNPLNIFCLSISEFDFLCAYSKESGKSLVDCLKSARANNESPITASFMFTSHFRNHNIMINSYSHITGKFSEIMDRVREGFRLTELGLRT